MTPQAVDALADYLAQVDADWRQANGYAGKSIHCRAYWHNMAARILHDSVKNLKPTKKP